MRLRKSARPDCGKTMLNGRTSALSLRVCCVVSVMAGFSVFRGLEAVDVGDRLGESLEGLLGHVVPDARERPGRCPGRRRPARAAGAWTPAVRRCPALPGTRRGGCRLAGAEHDAGGSSLMSGPHRRRAAGPSATAGPRCLQPTLCWTHKTSNRFLEISNQGWQGPELGLLASQVRGYRTARSGSSRLAGAAGITITGLGGCGSGALCDAQVMDSGDAHPDGMGAGGYRVRGLSWRLTITSISTR